MQRRSPFIRRPMAIVLSPPQGSATASGTADDLAAYMRISSITGMAGRLSLAIPVRSVRVAVQSPSDPTLSGTQLSRPQFSTLSVTKAIDLTSPELMALTVAGTMVPEVTVELLDRKINQGFQPAQGARHGPKACTMQSMRSRGLVSGLRFGVVSFVSVQKSKFPRPGLIQGG